MGLLDRYIERRIQNAVADRGFRIRGSYIHPDIEEIAGIERAGWQDKLQELHQSGVPIAGVGGFFQAVPAPGNSEPQTAPSAATGGTSEVNLYTPATTSGNDFALIPQPGAFRAPQAWLISASGVITSSGGGQTNAMTARIGTSGTPSSNASLGATGAVALGSTITNALWTYVGFMQVTATGTGSNGKATGWGVYTVSQQAAGSASTAAIGMHGNTTASFDSTIQQGYVLSGTPSASGVSQQLIQFVMGSFD